MSKHHDSRVFVLVHGAWHGGWCWKPVAQRLRTRGHEVYTPTMTGYGERAHLLRADTGLSTNIDDICAVLECEELSDVVLVGHSFGGVVISGVADRLASRLRQLIYLDALVVPHGYPAVSALSPEVQKTRCRTIDPEGWRMAVPDASAFGVNEPTQVAWLARRLTPQPLKAYTDPLELQHPQGHDHRKTYVAVTAPAYAPLAALREAIRQQPEWEYRELLAGHDAMITSPQALSELLCELAR
jgi:pimeloyl-ACP methyl ester carboxylesterase